MSVIHLALITNFFLFPVFCFSLLQAQDLQSAQQASRADSLVRLEHTTHPLALLANDAGRVEADKNLQRIVLVLAPSSDQENELGRFLDEQQNRNSKNYHQWLTPRQFAERFSPADPGIEAVRNWLQQNGLTVGQVAAGKRWIEFSGTARQVEAALHTELHYYNVAGKNYLANSGDVSLPSSLAALSRGVVSLNNFPRLPPRQFSKGAAGRDARGQFVHLRPNLTATGQSNTYYLAPGDFAAIYNSKPLLSGGNDGTGVSIAVIAQSNIEVTDVQAFRSIFGLKANDPNILYSGPDPGFSSAIDSQEAMLDTEWAGAVAPGATINVVIAGSTDTTNGVDLAAAYAIDNEIAPILTYTYGSCEAALGTSGNAFYNALWQQAAAEGITVVVAAGDNGAAGCDNATEGTPATQGQAINGAASTPYNLAVGGTQLADVGHAANYWNPVNASDFSSAIGYIPEQAWNESCDPGQPATATNCVFGSGNFTLLAGAGGASTVYSKPAWQTGPGVPADGARDVPDVALAAASDHDDIVYCNSLGGTPCQIANGNVLGLTLVGGTSVSTPAMAGILALVEQKEGSYLGQVNYTLYQLAKTGSCNSSTQTSPSTQTSCIFYDVTAGNNSVPCAGGTPGCSTQAGANGILAGQAATTGFDMATGLGSLNVTNLANAWSSAKRAASQTTLHTASSSFAHGTAITVNGSVAPATGSGSPTGDVSLKTDLYGDAGLLTLSGGAFSSSLNILPGGKYNLFAHYAGDASYGSSDSAQLSLTVTPEASITNLSLPELSGGVAAYGSTLPIKVNVAGVSGAATATGNITIFDNNTIVGNYTLAADGGAYVLTGAATGNSFAPGAHSLTAKYAGDNSFDTSTSNAVAFTIGKSTPQVILGANTLNVNVGASVAVHAVVVASSGFSAHPATGTIQFTDNGATILSPVTLQTAGLFGTQSQASAILPNLSAGTHVIGATYNAAGDPNYNNVASGDPQNEFLQTVTVGPSSGTQTTTRLSVTAPVNMGDTASFSINVSPATATGSVAVWDAVGLRGSPGNISGGTVTISLPWTQAGNTAVYAVYSGNASNAPSSSTPVPFTVNKLAPQVQLVAPAGFSLNQQTSLNVTVAGRPSNAALPYPTGSVEFWDSLNGGAPQLLSVQMLTVGGGNVAVFALRTKLPPGSHSLHAHYRGDTNWLGADSAAVALSSSDFTVSVSPNPLLVSGGSAGSATVSVAPAGGFTGIVALSCPTGGTAPPAGYACTFSPSSSVDVTVGSVSATLTLAPATAAAATVKQTALLQKPKSTHSDATIFPGLGLKFPGLGAVAGLAVAFGISLLILFLGMKRLRPSVGYAAMAATALTVIVIGCGGGSGGGGGTPPVASTTTLTSSNLKAQFQAPVNFNVNVSSAGSPTGMVQLYDNGQVFGNAVPLNAGLALFTSDALPVGLHSLSAKYQGDTNTLPSTSASISQIITGTVNLQITASSQSGASHTANFNATVN